MNTIMHPYHYYDTSMSFLQQEKLVKKVKENIQQLANTPDQSLAEQADTAADLTNMLKSLDPLTKQVSKLKTSMTSYGEDINKLSAPALLKIMKKFSTGKDFVQIEHYLDEYNLT